MSAPATAAAPAATPAPAAAAPAAKAAAPAVALPPEQAAKVEAMYAAYSKLNAAGTAPGPEVSASSCLALPGFPASVVVCRAASGARRMRGVCRSRLSAA